MMKRLYRKRDNGRVELGRTVSEEWLNCEGYEPTDEVRVPLGWNPVYVVRRYRSSYDDPDILIAESLLL